MVLLRHCINTANKTYACGKCLITDKVEIK